MAPERMSDGMIASPEVIFHWLVGIVMSVTATVGTWAVKTLIGHNEDIALLKQTVASGEERATERHEETLEMLREIRASMRE